MAYEDLFQKLGLKKEIYQGGTLIVRSPIDGGEIGRVHETSLGKLDSLIENAHTSYLIWRDVPAPKRGELIRLFGEELRANKEALGRLVTIECGKILEEGRGEVQEMIDICDFAVGLSRQLYGLTIASERPGHRMMETWHPLGVVGLITPFNFPVAVWAWNFALAIVCGNACLWKPSEKTPLTALACQSLFEKALARFKDAPKTLSTLVIGQRDLGEKIIDDPRIPLISATGSTAMGRQVGTRAAARFAQVILELGGNNAMIVTPSANLDLVTRAILFSAAGTAGQRCTSLRRLFIHESVYDRLVHALKKSYQSISVGNPLESGTLIGPLIDEASFLHMQKSLAQAKQEGGIVQGGARTLAERFSKAYYVHPALVEMPGQTDIVRHETFSPILYVIKYKNFEEVLQLHNDVPQGLSSCIFTNDIIEAETFLSAKGSDCGIVNVNIGPSGAEIGGAFGGNKETGWGRESGSDSWRNYMRRATNTINYSRELPLAQGIKFDVS